MNAGPAPRDEGPSIRATLRVVATVALSAGAIYILYLVREPLGHIFLGAFLAVAASGPVNLLSRKLPRGPGRGARPVPRGRGRPVRRCAGGEAATLTRGG